MNSFFIKYFAKHLLNIYVNMGLSAYTYTITQTYVICQNAPSVIFFGVKMSHASVEITQLTGNDTKKGP